MSLKSEIIGSCELCSDGFSENGLACTCMLKFRAYSKLIEKGFSKKLLDVASHSSYSLPVIESGQDFVKFFYENPIVVEEKGLSLFMHSKERGRGKTTLAHSLIYNAANYFSDINIYKTERTYQFLHIEDLLKNVKKDKFDSCESTWLVIDDLGNEDKSADWKKANIISGLQRILHYRRDRDLPTIITSNYTPSSLSSLYNGDLDSLMEIGYDGSIKGIQFREIEVGGGEDLRLAEDLSNWPI